MNNKQIGIGITTKDRLDYLTQLLESLEPVKSEAEIVVVNDGAPLPNSLDSVTLLQNPKNLGIAKTKNKAFRFLLEKQCNYIFLLEDDVFIKDPLVFEKYVGAYKQTNIHHFNYGPGTPFNRKQDVQFDIHNRSELKQDSKPNPRLTIQYDKDFSLDLYLHVAGMFSFFTKEILEKVGLFDEQFYNAWEHVDHTYRIIKAGGHPPFWWFADIHDSSNYIGEQQDAIQKSTTSNSPEWMQNVNKGRELYFKKHGHFPNNPPQFQQSEVLNILKKLKHG